MKSGRPLWNELARPYVDARRFGVVQDKLRAQSGSAVLWKAACLLYFQQFSRLPSPAAVEPPMHTLEAAIANDARR